jgi:hypothetical protein
MNSMLVDKTPNIYIWKFKDDRKKVMTAIPEAPLRRTFGRRAGKTTGSSCEPSKLGLKSTCSQQINLDVRKMSGQAPPDSQMTARRTSIKL